MSLIIVSTVYVYFRGGIDTHTYSTEPSDDYLQDFIVMDEIGGKIKKLGNISLGMVAEK